MITFTLFLIAMFSIATTLTDTIKYTIFCICFTLAFYSVGELATLVKLVVALSISMIGYIAIMWLLGEIE